MNEKEFEDWIKPIEITPPLLDQRSFVLFHELIYKRLIRLVEKSDCSDKEKIIEELTLQYDSSRS